MCASVEEVLREEFGVGLGDEGVNILDPATGTGNFIVHLMQRIPKQKLEYAYRNQLFANEVMLLPYYIAALNIEHEYRDLTGHYEPFEGLCFVDTLDLAEGRQLPMFAEKNTQRVEREKQTPITVIIGNPPYNVGQLNENDNNKNRKYKIIDERVSETYAVDSAATNKNALSDAYVKFIRWATDRLQGRDGIVCFVSNNSFVDQIAFDGMRKHLLKDFSRIYHLDLHGNVRKNPKLSGTTHNVFGIQVGVGITVAVRSVEHEDHRLYYYRVPEFWRREEKLRWLAACADSTSYRPFVGMEIEGEDTLSPTDSLQTGPRQAPHPRTPSPQAGRGAYERSAGWPTSPENWHMLKPAARELRRERTPAEDRLWQRLRHQQLGCKFRRQQSIDRFIVDYYCHEASLIVEVDGPVHDYTPEEDSLRQAYLESLGYQVIRFRNEDVFESLDGVVELIMEALRNSPPASSDPQGNFLPASPARGEGEESATPSLLAGRGQGVGSQVPWRELVPDAHYTWLIPQRADEFASLIPIGSRETKAAGDLDAEAIFGVFSNGVKTNRDAVVYDFDRAALIERVRQAIDDYNTEVDRWRRSGGKDSVDDFVRYERIKWSEGLKANLKRGQYADFSESEIRCALYRPFTKQFLFFDDVLNERRYQFPSIFPTPATELENRVIALTDLGSEKPFMTLISDGITDLHLVGAGSGTQCFPFYVYETHSSAFSSYAGETPPPHPLPASREGERRENITDWALAQFREHYGDEAITKWDIFYYVYGLLHHPGYRERYADNLKRDLPRLPFAPDFWAFAEAGRALADLHLNYETVEPYELQWIVDDSVPMSYHVEKMRLSPDRTSLEVNDWLTLADIPPEVYEYRLGNRSALEWVIDQYQVKTDARSGITSDPNNRDNPEYIVRLVERVVRVSLETMQIVNALAQNDVLEDTYR
ncbi:MAG TPA: type ISP restriction/modification enzyme, partial [Aggregatilineaceae bacterium]|nr:type ISP restriction/modification enzyme [Aggregatilineaceae bacterium]